MRRATDKIGLWLVGAAGRVGSAVALGVSALGRKAIPAKGLVSELPPFRPLRLIDPGQLVIGGHEIRCESVLDAVRAAHRQAGVFDADLIQRCVPDLRAVQRNIAPGTLHGAGGTIRKLADGNDRLRDSSAAQAVERLSADIQSFRRRHHLRDVIVMHVASCEPHFPLKSVHARWDRLQRALVDRRAPVLPPSSLYALAAVEARCPFINFTPSLGINVPAIRERADALDLPYMGRDGKTGETLVKSVLAPMFALRNLEVLSWVGQNILGNRDGAVLRDPRTKRSKIAAKDRLVSRIVGGRPTTHVSIDYVPSLDDWKVAWDYIHFQGFLGTKMSLQFTWSGCDSILAAPLVIDLARFAAHEHERNHAGPMRHLAFFFKDPLDVDELDLFSQWSKLVAHVAGP